MILPAMALSMKASTASCAKLAAPQKTHARARTAPAVSASLREDVSRYAAAAGVGIATLGLALSANAATVKLGAAGGALVFEPAEVTIKSGETVTWTNNIGYPHNVVFDEDNIPSGASADKLSHEDYLNSPGETVSSKFDTPGEYSYYCEPHQGAGMAGKIIVQ